MEPTERCGSSSTPELQNALIVSEVRFLCDCLIDILGRVPGIGIRACAGTIAGALASAETTRPKLILLDVAFPEGPKIAMKLSGSRPDARLIAIGIRETEDNVLSWAEAGIAGYVPNTSSLDDLVALIGQIGRGEQTCPAHIAGSLLRRVAASGRRARPELLEHLPLTRREIEVLGLVNAGLTNKDIARRLSISLSTAKTHVHHVLGKLKLPRRANVMARMRGGPDGGPSGTAAGFP